MTAKQVFGYEQAAEQIANICLTKMKCMKKSFAFRGTLLLLYRQMHRNERKIRTVILESKAIQNGYKKQTEENETDCMACW